MKKSALVLNAGKPGQLQSGDWIGPRKTVAAVDPVVGDDETSGYEIGSRWINTALEKEFVCVSAVTGAAVWVETTGVGVGVSAGPTGTVDSVPVPGREFNVLTLTDTVTIQGFAAPAITDRPVFLTVISNNATTFKHMNSATGADNIFMPQLADLYVNPGSVTQFVYSGGVWNHAGGAQAIEPA